MMVTSAIGFFMVRIFTGIQVARYDHWDHAVSESDQSNLSGPWHRCRHGCPWAAMESSGKNSVRGLRGVRTLHRRSLNQVPLAQGSIVGRRRPAGVGRVGWFGFAEPEEIAAAVLFLASDEARHVTGADLPMEDRLFDHLSVKIAAT
jgi:NAD(P)-dependent dehydrogenase (short-subunit alcohol dehydrogenase family)